jgi:hypothetical protein
MRIVAGRAFKTRIALAPALARNQTIWADLVVDTPFTPASFTSHHELWHAPQNSTASTGLRCAELKMAAFLAFGVTDGEFIAATCFAPGP